VTEEEKHNVLLGGMAAAHTESLGLNRQPAGPVFHSVIGRVNRQAPKSSAKERLDNATLHNGMQPRRCFHAPSRFKGHERAGHLPKDSQVATRKLRVCHRTRYITNHYSGVKKDPLRSDFDCTENHRQEITSLQEPLAVLRHLRALKQHHL